MQIWKDSADYLIKNSWRRCTRMLGIALHDVDQTREICTHATFYAFLKNYKQVWQAICHNGGIAP